MDIQSILTDLSSVMTDAEIARIMRASGHPIAQATITRLRHGTHKQTYYDRHKRLLELHSKIFLKDGLARVRNRRTAKNGQGLQEEEKIISGEVGE